MRLSLWIPSSWQIGAVAPEEGRPDAFWRRLAEGIKYHLFADAALSAGEDGSTGRFAQVFDGFSEAVSQVEVADRPVSRTLWKALFPDETPKDATAGFCIAVNGLCLALARHHLRLTEPLEVEEGEGEDDASDNGAEELWEDDDDPEAAPALMIPRAQVERAVAQLLLRATWRLQREAGVVERAEYPSEARQVAAILLECLLRAMPQWFTQEQQRGHGGTRLIAVKNPQQVSKIEALLAALPFRYTLQPLDRPVQYAIDGHPVEADYQDCFRVDLIGYRATNVFLRRLHAGAMDQNHHAKEFTRYLRAVNCQQAVPWRINRELLHWARQLTDLARTGAGDPKLQDWVAQRFYRDVGEAPRRLYKRPGEFLDHVLARRALSELCPEHENGADDPAADPPTFYLPWKADYRGRIYAETPWLTPQGGDLQRALFEFANGQRLYDAGVAALRRHGANLVERAVLLNHFGISDRQVASLEERERWVEDHHAQIIASASSPLTEPFWREVTGVKAGKPMQFLAFCLAYRRWAEDPEALIHLPVQIDGTCNGFQHIAALTGDQDVARAVNVLPQENGLPGDIYSELASAAAERVGTLKSRDRVHGLGLHLADAWLAKSPHKWLQRGTAKKIVMTTPYGAGIGAQTGHVLEAIGEEMEEQLAQSPLEELDALVEWIQESPQRIDFVRKRTRGRFGSLRRRAFGATGNAVTLAEWLHQSGPVAYVARAIVVHLRDTLSARYPRADEFMEWLSATGKRCRGMPLAWFSPLGLPVCQDKFTRVGTSRTARIDQQIVRVDLQQLGEKVNSPAQETALLPSLIHSLDATHLAMTITAASSERVTDVGSIHDCLLCHPNDADRLGKVLSRTFAELYRPEDAGGRPAVLLRWERWMELVARLRVLPEATLVLGALDYPGGVGELLLRAKADTDDAARESLAVLNVVRALRPPEHFLARTLLEYSLKYPPNNAVLREAPALPGAASLPLGSGEGLSAYFFS